MELAREAAVTACEEKIEEKKNMVDDMKQIALFNTKLAPNNPCLPPQGKSATVMDRRGGGRGSAGAATRAETRL